MSKPEVPTQPAPEIFASSNYLQVEQEYKVVYEKTCYDPFRPYLGKPTYKTTQSELTQAAYDELILALRADPAVTSIKVYHRMKVNWNGPREMKKEWVDV